VDKKYQELLGAITKGYSNLIGLAVVIRKADNLGLKIDNNGQVLEYKGDPVKLIENLLNEFVELSGDAAIKFCKDAIAEVLTKYPDIEIPSILK